MIVRMYFSLFIFLVIGIRQRAGKTRGNFFIWAPEDFEFRKAS
jgi:hypothetical protein